jgi:hydrogenase-4 component H
MNPKSKGKPQFYKDGCVGCGACAKVCPASAIEIIDDIRTHTRKLVLKLDECIFCGSCEENCITQKGIRLGSQYDTIIRDRTQAVVSLDKELMVCEACGAVLAAKDHLKFLAVRLGPLAYANPTLIQTNQEELKLSGNSTHSPEAPKQAASRAVIFKALCPACRWPAMLEEI